MVNFSKRKMRAEAPRFFEAFTDDDGAAFGNYAWSLIDRRLIARWKTGVEPDGEAWAELIDAEDRVASRRLLRLAKFDKFFLVNTGLKTS